MHRFAKPPGACVDRGESRIRRSGSRIRNSGSTRPAVAFAHAKPSEGHLRIGFLRAGKRLRHSGAQRARALAASLGGRRFRLRGKRPRATRFAGAGWQGARNVTELVCCVTNEKYRCFCGVFCVSGFPERRSREAGKRGVIERDREGISGGRRVVSRRCAATRSRDVTSLYCAAPFRQNWSYACAEFAKPFCLASSHGRSHRCVVSHHE